MKTKTLPLVCCCIILALTLFLALSAHAQDQAALEKRLEYLNDIPEVSWVKFDGNNVHIGFNKRPSDLGSIVRDAGFW